MKEIKKKIKRDFRISVAIYAFILVIALALVITEKSNVKENVNISAVMTEDIAIPNISAENCVLIDEKGHVLYEKNSRERAYPASITKILTCITAIERLEELESNIDQIVAVPKDAVGIEGSSIYLKKEEKISIRDLLYAAMLRSGNDSATAISIIMGGDIESFVDMMNEKAEKIGCVNSNFVNPTGLFDENHYTTAKDMAKIAAYAMKNKAFREIAGAKMHVARRQAFSVTEEGGKKYIDYNMYNKNKTVHEYDGATGIKIGYTKISGRTLVASAKRKNREVIVVLMADPNWFDDAYKLMDYGFELLKGE